MSADGSDTQIASLHGEPQTNQEADNIIADIRHQHSYLTDENIAFLNSEVASEQGKEVLQKFNRLYEQELKSIKSTTNINASAAHFILELLQNADDALYNEANEEPYIKFHLDEGKIVVETNEDGFTRKDVEAICSVRESSKNSDVTGSSIGEKGIGFRSVFLVAEKVHVTSGYWSFSFKYPDGNNGSGMVVPHLEPRVPLEEGVRTRIVLYLNHSYRTKQQEHQRIRQDFENLPDTTILFLRKIRSMKTTITSIESGESTTMSVAITASKNLESNQGKIIKSITTSTPGKDTLHTESTRVFFVFASEELDMPADSHRQHRRHQSTRVELAFPMEQDGQKAIIEAEGQFMFAFLPLYRTQLNFMIQSNFITVDSRESIVEDCPWNNELRQATANTFCDAVVAMCTVEILVYEWPRYLPSLPLGDFWKPLRSMILEGLQHRTIFFKGPLDLATPSEVRRLKDSYFYDGERLLRDIPNHNLYLPEEYEDYPDLLEELQVNYITWQEIFDRLQYDLQRKSSLVKLSTEIEWHEALASLLLEIWDEDDANEWINKLKTLDMILLKTEREWCSIVKTPWSSTPGLYFPDLDGIAIPENLGFSLVDLDTQISPQRFLLFQKMGVQTCATPTVINKILDMHKSTTPLSQDPKIATQHLYFLYYFGEKLRSKNRSLWVITESLDPVRSTTELYLASNKSYSVDWLLHNEPELESWEYPCRNKWLLHTHYFDQNLQNRPRDNISWLSWLRQELDAHIYPAFTTTLSNGQKRLSFFLTELSQKSSQVFLSTIQARWDPEYKTQYFGSAFPRGLLEQCEVNYTNGSCGPLVDAYQPNEVIISRAEKLGVRNYTAILSLDLRERPFVPNEWSALRDLKVCDEADIKFHIRALRVMSAQNIENRAVDIYTHLGKKVNQEQVTDIRADFTKENLICIPVRSSSQDWCRSQDCVWNAPEVVTIKRSLKLHYEHDMNASYFFRKVLGMKDATWRDLVDELKEVRVVDANRELSMTVRATLSKVERIYSELLSAKSVDWEQVRQIFTDYKLVFVSRKWFSPTKCFWTSAIAIEGRPTLAMHYTPLLEHFFTIKLGVEKADIRQITAELIKRTQSSLGITPPEAKVFIKQISSMMASDEPDSAFEEQLKELSQENFLPVRKGLNPIMLVNCSHDFAIRDDLTLSRAFAKDCTFLDFSFEEMPQVSRLLEALPITMRNISQLVEKELSIGDDALLDLALTNELVHKAPFLFSCAYKYGSSSVLVSDRVLLDKLQSIQVYTCSSIIMKLILEQGEMEFESEIQGAQVFVDCEDENNRRIYVPRDKQQRRSAYRSKLPSEFMEENLMSLDDDRARSSIALILTSPLADMEDVMLSENIPYVPWLDRRVYNIVGAEGQEEPETIPIETDGENGERRSATVSAINATEPGSGYGDDESIDGSERQSSSRPANAWTEWISGNTKNPGFAQSFSSGTTHAYPPTSIFDPARPVNLRSRHATITPAASEATTLISDDIVTRASSENHTSGFGSPSPLMSQPGHRYTALLNQIIICATRASQNSGRTRDGSSSGIFDLASLGNTLPLVFDLKSAFGTPGLVRDFKIGAAGELFVFEHLKRLELPGFDTDSWKSKIRKHVRCHPFYETMTSWNGTETADIVYHDHSGQLGDWLRNISCNGFPKTSDDFGKTEKTKCTYYIEVKTTASRNCDEKFYMSQNEYGLMEDFRTNGTTDPEEIYVIVRVFSVMNTDIDFKIFVDPWRSRNTGESSPYPNLTFELGKWNVTPDTKLVRGVTNMG